MNDEIILSPKQKEIADDIFHFFLESTKQIYIFSGVAGSGKTSIINVVCDTLSNGVLYDYRIAVLALTGQACKVLRNKGLTQAQTIHSFLYKPIIVNDILIGFEKKSKSEFSEWDYITIDEGSMLTDEIVNDIYSIGLKILIVGDVNQVPSISNDGFNIMEDCDVRLEEIHRLAADNPIIKLSQHILSYDTLPRSFQSEHINFINRHKSREYLESVGNLHDVIIVGMNKTRISYNNIMRKINNNHLSRIGVVGENAMCLRNNTQHPHNIFNGEVFKIIDVKQYKDHNTKHDLHNYTMQNEDGNIVYDCIINDDIWRDGKDDLGFIKVVDNEGETKKINIDKFTYAHSVTVHKCQGSQYDNPMFVDEDVSFFLSQQKFRYTAVTRSSNKITIAK